LTFRKIHFLEDVSVRFSETLTVSTLCCHPERGLTLTLNLLENIKSVWIRNNSYYFDTTVLCCFSFKEEEELCGLVTLLCVKKNFLPLTKCS